MRRACLLLLVIGSTVYVWGATGFDYGDLVVTCADIDAAAGAPSSIQIYSRDGTFRRELIHVDSFWTEPLYRDGIVYVGSRDPYQIERIDGEGNLLTPFATGTVNVNFLSPGPGGGLLAVNGSGEIYQFDVHGALIRKRDVLQHPLADGGIDLATDGCTVFYGASGSLARWNACVNDTADFFGPDLAAAAQGMRSLSDGTFLIAVIGLLPGTGNNRVIHVGAGGNLIRSYAIPGYSIALDVDGTSFWTSVGNTLVHADIATGEILSLTNADAAIFGISVVGEPRAGLISAAAMPTMSALLLAVLAAALGIAAVVRLRAV
jgi:hypothetical protein